MKSLFVTVILFFSMPAAFAQVVTYEPAFPTENSSLKVIFDATQGAGGLKDFDGDVYLHTGVITNNSTNGSDWKYVPFGWTTNNASVKATPLGNNKWEFTYTPSVREFFGITNAGETVEKVAIVFKGVKGGNVVAEGKDVGATDIFIDMTSGGASARFLSPAAEFYVLDADSTLEIVGVGEVQEGSLTLSLLKNGTEIETTSADSIFYSFTPQADDADILFSLVATNNDGLNDTASVFLTVKRGNGALLNRPAGLQDGITLENTSATFSLFAPYKEYVYVIGDFNDWKPSSEYLMNVEHSGSDSTWFWLQVDGLAPGQQYGMQYFIDGETRIADPYSELVLDEFNDQYIPDHVFPNLKAYPKGKTGGLVTLIEPGKQEYVWEVTDFERPHKEELVIYELLIRDFLENKNYSTLIDTLDYLENLGINAIELMPVNEFDGNLSWGYNPALHYALDKFYGTPQDFKRFVDEAHKRGIAVIVDLVLNHATGQNPLYRMYQHGDNPYFNAVPKHAYNVFNDFNHQYSGTRHYTKRVVQYWIDEYKIDGFRWDLTKGFTQNCSDNDHGCTGSYQADRVEVLKKYADYQWEVDPEFIVIFEHLGGENEEKEWANYRVDEGKGILLWGNMNHQYSEATMGYTSNLYGVLSESRPSFQKRHLIGYMESHDEQWLMTKNIMFGNSSSNHDYDIKDWGTAFGRQKLAGAFFFTLPGPKMMWQFGELGYGYGENGEQCLRDAEYCPSIAPGRTSEKPVRWDYYDDPDRIKIYKTWSALINLRRSSPAFTAPEKADYKLSGTIKSIVLEHEDSDVVIIGNFGMNPTEAEINFPATGTWYDFFEGEAVEIDEASQSIPLNLGEFRIFTTRQFAAPEEGLLTHTEQQLADLPKLFRLNQNYPNPFNPSTVISYQLPVQSQVKLQVFDITGRMVATLVEGPQAAGEHQIVFNAGNLASGMYITRLQAGGKVFTQKMMLIK